MGGKNSKQAVILTILLVTGYGLADSATAFGGQTNSADIPSTLLQETSRPATTTTTTTPTTTTSTTTTTTTTTSTTTTSTTLTTTTTTTSTTTTSTTLTTTSTTTTTTEPSTSTTTKETTTSTTTTTTSTKETSTTTSQSQESTTSTVTEDTTIRKTTSTETSPTLVITVPSKASFGPSANAIQYTFVVDGTVKKSESGGSVSNATIDSDDTIKEQNGYKLVSGKVANTDKADSFVIDGKIIRFSVSLTHETREQVELYYEGERVTPATLANLNDKGSRPPSDDGVTFMNATAVKVTGDYDEYKLNAFVGDPTDLVNVNAKGELSPPTILNSANVFAPSDRTHQIFKLTLSGGVQEENVVENPYDGPWVSTTTDSTVDTTTAIKTSSTDQTETVENESINMEADTVNTSITYGQIVRGTVDTNNPSNFYGVYDRITFRGEKGDKINVSLQVWSNKSGVSVDASLILVSPTQEREIIKDKNSTKRPIKIKSHRLEETGRYSILVASNEPNSYEPEVRELTYELSLNRGASVCWCEKIPHGFATVTSQTQKGADLHIEQEPRSHPSLGNWLLASFDFSPTGVTSFRAALRAGPLEREDGSRNFETKRRGTYSGGSIRG